MDHSMLPLNYFCRNARLSIKKAAFSRKAQLFGDELLHLKKFLALMMTTIPSHPLYEEKKTEKPIVELQTLLPDIKRRMQQLEGELSSIKPKDSNGTLKSRKLHPKPLSLPSFSSDDVLPAAVQPQKHVRKAKNAGLKQPRKHITREPWCLLSANDTDQASPSASNSVSPTKEHTFDDPQDRRSRTATSPVSKGLNDVMPHRTVREAAVTSTKDMLNNEAGLSTTLANRAFFADSCETEACFRSQKGIEKWHIPAKSGHFNKDKIAKLSTCRDFQSIKAEHSITGGAYSMSHVLVESQNETMPPYDKSKNADQREGGGIQTLPRIDMARAHAYGNKENGSQNAGKRGTTEATEAEESTGYVKSWWNRSGRENNLSLDNTKGKPESMHKGWVSLSPNKGARLVTGTNASAIRGDVHQEIGTGVQADEHAEMSGLDDKVTGNPANKIEKGIKDTSGITVRSKLEEEYEKLRDQMRWFKNKDGASGKEQNEKVHSGITLSNASNTRTTGCLDGGNELYKQLSLPSNEDMACGDKHNIAGDALQNTETRQTLEYPVGTRYKGIMQRDKASGHVYPVADTMPSTTSPHPSSLPFSHYISKLKQLAPKDLLTVSTRTCSPMETVTDQTYSLNHGSDSPFIGGLRPAPSNDQPENVGAHSPSSTSTFPDSLTYSNPVFELDGDLDPNSAENRSTEVEKGASKTNIIIDGHLDDAGIQSSQQSPQLSCSTEKLHELSSSICTLSEHKVDDFATSLRDCVINIPVTEALNKPRSQTPILKEHKVEDLEIAGHKFRFVNDFSLKRTKENLIEVEKIKSSCQEDKYIRGSSPIKAPTEMQVDANFGRLGSLLGEKHIGWTNAQDWVEKQALSVHSSSFLCANVSAAKQNKSAAKNSNRSLIFSDPCQEDSEAAREGPSPQNHKKEEVVQDVSTGKESESFPSPLEKSGPSGSYCDKIQETFLHHVEQGTMRPNIADCNYDPEDEWRLKIAQLEHDFSRENNSLRSHIDKDVCIKLDELVNALGLIQQLLVNKEHEKEQFAYELQLKMEDCEGKVSLIQEQLNRLIDDVKPILIKDAKGNICFDLQTVEDVCKSQLEKVEKKLSKNVEILRCEMASSIESSQTQTETRIKAGCDALESSVLQKIVGNGTLNSSSGMDAVAELRNELCLMWDEIRQLSKCRDEIREQVGKLTKVAGETQETLKREHSVILAESEVVKRSLKSLKRESAKSRKERQELRREVQEIVQNFQKAVAEIKEDSMREAENTKRLERSLLNDKVCVENVYERVKNTELVVKDDLEHMKSITDEILREKNNSGILEKELMERMDQLSHYYFSALEEVRADLLAVKMIGQDKLQEMEYRWEDIMRKQHQNAIGRGSSLHDLVMDSLESRLSHLEHVLDSSEDLQRAQFKVDSILAITEKDQECASAAAAKAMVSAEKADEVVSSILESFRSEMESARTKSLELQERLQLESQAMTTACSEIRALCADLIQEKNIAVAASSEAKIRSFEIWEGLQNDMMSLRNTLCLINKDKDLTSAAANEAMAAASQAEALLEGLSKAYEEVAALHTGREEGGTPLLTLKDMDSTQEPEDKNSEMEEMKERMQDMVAAISRVAKSTSQLDEEQRKQGMCILDLSKQIMTVTVEKNGILERVSDVSKKVQNMDCSLANLSEALDKVHTSTQYLEKAAAKHETAENAVLADFERRICYLENPFQRDNTPDITDQPVERQQIGAMEKQHLLSLYKEMSSFFKKLQKLEGQEDDASDADKQVQAALTTLGTRVTHLESKVHQIETGTSLATRTLDSRMDIFSSQLKTAIDAAMTAEGKCSALGSELVKVFRTLASSKKESPSKPTEYEENNDPKKHPKSEVPPGSKYKVPPNTSVYRKVSNKGSSTSTDSSSKECSEIESKAFGSKPDVDYQVKNQDIMDTEGLKASQGKTREDQTKCNTHASTHENSSLCYPASISSGYIGVSSANANDSTIHSYKGSASAARMVIHGTDGAVIKMGRKFSLTAHSQSKKQAGEQSEGSSKNPEGDKVWNVVRREDSGVMVLESKLPITHGKLGKRRIECGKKENIHMSSATGDYQMTDIRLNAGRIFVNVSHRSAFISGTRLLKRGDTLTVKSEA